MTQSWTPARTTAVALAALVALPAAAHVPHDGALFAASWPGGDRPVLTTIYRDSGILLSRLGDEITQVESRFLAPQKDDLRNIVYVDADRLVAAAADAGLWVSDDLGDTWSEHADLAEETLVAVVSASPTVDTDGVALAGATSGLWRTDDRGDTWRRVLETDDEVVAISWSNTWSDTPVVCVLIGVQQVDCSDDLGATWVPFGTSTLRLTDIALQGDDTVWGAGSDGLVRSVGGAAWAQRGLQGAMVRYVLALADRTMLASRDEEAVWRSTDEGESWSLESTGLDENETGVGAPRDGIFYRQLVQERSGRVLMATWSGLYWSVDSGLSWNQVETEMPWVTRSIDMASATDGAPWVLIGKYGGGITKVRVDGSDAQAVGADMPVRYTRSVAIGAGSSEAQVLLVTDFGKVNASLDGGWTWTTHSGEDWSELGFVDVADAPSARPVALLAGDVLDDSTFARSTDGGQTWAAVPTDGTCLGGRRVLDMPPDWTTQPEAWAGCRTDGAIYVTLDRGESWTLLGTPAPSWLMQIKGLPGQGAALAATTEGLYRVTVDGTASLVAFEDQQVNSIAVSPGFADDGTAFALVAGQGWYRSTDGTETWEALDRPTMAHCDVMEVSPDFAVDHALTVGCYDGAWGSSDAGEHWDSISAAERIEEDHDLWQFSEGWTTDKVKPSSGGRRMDAEWPGVTSELWFVGSAFDLIGPTLPDGGVLSVSLDGGDPIDVDVWGEETDQTVLLRVTELEPGTHRLTFEVASAPVALDALIAWHTDPSLHTDTGDSGHISDSGTLDDTQVPGDSGDTDTRCAGCSVQGRPAGLVWGLVAMGLVGLRRRR